MVEPKGFFASLFDLSFNWLITTKVIKVIYVINMIIIGLFALLMVLVAFHANAGLGAAMLLIGAPLIALFSLIYVRMTLEFFSAVFKIMESSRDLLAVTRGQLAAVASAQSERTSSQVA